MELEFVCPLLIISVIHLINSKRKSIPSTKDKRSSTIFKIIARIEPNVTFTEPEIAAKIEVKIESKPIEIIGEKSILRILNHPRLEKRFIYGSQILEINLPNFVNLDPGIQESITFIKHKIV